MAKFKQISNSKHDLYALGEDGEIYKIEFYTDRTVEGHIETVSHKTRAVKLDPFGGTPYATSQSDTRDIPF